MILLSSREQRTRRAFALINGCSSVLCAASLARRSHDMKVECSAAGKVLVAGGYVVLFRPHTALSLSSSARFYSSVESIAVEQQHESHADSFEIVVESPQFHREWRFTGSWDSATRSLKLSPQYVVA